MTRREPDPTPITRFERPYPLTPNPDNPFAVLETEVANQAAEEEAAKRLATARAKLILGRDAKSAFFATLALRLTPEVDWSCETMATDGTRLSYHPEFVTGLSPDELLGVLVHEVLHNALAHPFRRGCRDGATWNVACDLAVNPLLLDAGFVLPGSRLMPGEGRYGHLPVGQTADEYTGCSMSRLRLRSLTRHHPPIPTPAGAGR